MNSRLRAEFGGALLGVAVGHALGALAIVCERCGTAVSARHGGESLECRDELEGVTLEEPEEGEDDAYALLSR